jgi:hypothetical protein
MNLYTGWEYMLIDLANQFGLDKLLFEERIKWATDNLNDLEALADKADNYPLYMKAVMAIRKAQAGKPTGHLVGLDACCSGIQVMSSLTGCVAGATATGLVDPARRADAYTELSAIMQGILGPAFSVNRKNAKAALMTVFYGSKEQPKIIFGEDTPELNAFYEAAVKLAPGAWGLLQDLLNSWQPFALMHSWVLPDGFHVRVKVMAQQETRIEVDELAGSTFTYEYYENKGQKKGLSNVANVVHSVDAYILRTIHRRCNYNAEVVSNALEYIEAELNLRNLMSTGQMLKPAEGKLEECIKHYERSGIADVKILSFIRDGYDTMYLSIDHMEALKSIINTMLVHSPFEVVTIHDEFKCHPNNMNHLRQHYINIFAELADSDLLSDLLSQIHGKTGKFHKQSNNLSSLIRGSNYALS